MEQIRPPWRAIKEWIPVEADDPQFWDQIRDCFWKPAEIPLDDERILVLDYT